MAEENISSLLMPEDSPLDGDNSRRNSIGNAGSSKSREKILPRYLRASTGSCHDLCKYGKKLAFEEKSRHPISKRTMKKASGEQNSAKSFDCLPQVRPSPNSRSHTPDSSDSIKTQVSPKYPGSRKPRKHGASTDKKTSVVNLGPSSNSKSCLSDPLRFQRQVESQSSENVMVSLKEASSKAKGTSGSLKHATSWKLKSLAEKMPSSPSHSGGSYVRRLSGISNVKSNTRTVTSRVAVKNSLASPRASLSPISISRNSSLAAKQSRSLKDVSSLKKRNKVKNAEPEQPHNELMESNNDLHQEKTLYVIKMEMENQVFESDNNESCVIESSPLSPSSKLSSLPAFPCSSSSHDGGNQEGSEWTESEEENDGSSEYNETETLVGDHQKNENLDGEKGRRLMMGGMVCFDNKDSKPVKLHFRRGKVVDIQTGLNSPRRLKFRQGRVLDEHQSPKAVGQRSFKMRGVEREATNRKPDEEKVVLRHRVQDVQGKKDAQGLFNFVIEETASKLVETRKSKVKALVGAFETVISLQEKKPAAKDFCLS
ncbi:hypothetical protein SLE2022_191340 [Rubroshorea leprosula]